MGKIKRGYPVPEHEQAIAVRPIKYGVEKLLRSPAACFGKLHLFTVAPPQEINRILSYTET